MQVIERGGYSREEVLAVLHAKRHSRNVRFRYDLLDKNEKFIKTLDCVLSGEVSMSAFSNIKRTAKFKVKEQYNPPYVDREAKTTTTTYETTTQFNAWSMTSAMASSAYGDGDGALTFSNTYTPSSNSVANWDFQGGQKSSADVYGNYAPNNWTWWEWNGNQGTLRLNTAMGITGSASAELNNTAVGVNAMVTDLYTVLPSTPSVGQRVYLSFFYKYTNVQANYVYLMANDGAGNMAMSANATHTSVGSGWYRYESWVDMPRATNVGILIGVNSTSTNAQLIVDNVYLGYTQAVYTMTATSPIIDLSSNVYINNPPKYIASTITWSGIQGDWNTSYASGTYWRIRSRYSYDKGASWSLWTTEFTNSAIESIPVGRDISNLWVQFEYFAERYRWNDRPTLNDLTLQFTYDYDIWMPETTEINYLNNRIQPFMEVEMPDSGWIQFPLGIFLLSSPVKRDEVNDIYRDIEAYDGLIVLDDDKFTAPYYFASGTNYVTAIKQILTSASITKVNIRETTLTMGAPIEFKTGTSKLDAINQLLNAVNYTQLWVDATGYYTAFPYVSPADRAVDYTYADDQFSVVYNGAEEELDAFGIPNVWVVVQSNPEKSALVTTKTNSDLKSPTSTVNIGRNIVDYREVNDIADQTTLNAYVDRLAFEASQVFGTVRFKTALMPFHEYTDVLQFKYAGLKVDDKYSETGWRMPLKAGAEMEHECRKVVKV